MTKNELIAQLADEMPEFTAKMIGEVVAQVLEEIAARLESGEKVEIRNFGSWSLHMHKPRRGRNPKTGVWVDVPEKAVAYFRAGGLLKRQVDETVEILVNTDQDRL